MKRILLFAIPCLLAVVSLSAQAVNIQRLDPPFWWAGMSQPELEILVHGTEIAGSRVKIEYPGLYLHEVAQVESPNYLFLRITVSAEAKPGLVPIVFEKAGTRTLVQYELKARSRSEAAKAPVTQADLIYLIMPDRFANGDPANDNVAGLQQPTANREGKYQRHGGDLQGIIDRLDYLEDLGVTALWINPVEINDQPHESYHGYAATDHYRIDPRFGTNAQYAELVQQAHARGIKVIRDVVYNHVGDQHWFILDPPSSDWVHQWGSYTKTSYRAPTLIDPYASAADKKIMSEGWFDVHMPDLNQSNKHLATYLIQNSIWWIEHFGVNGYRIDTYAYPDQAFMADWGDAILREYPDFSFFGETWVHSVPVQSWFTERIANKTRDSRMPGVTDFQLQYALLDGLHQDFGWTEGLSRIYFILAQDYVYANPWNNVIFLDNHDISRFYASVNKDWEKMKMALGFLLTTRGIPQLYYGTEILMDEAFDWSNHDKVRMEFPGGWPGDKVNKFEASGRTAAEQVAFDYLRTLARYRRSSPALTAGSLTQFVPEEGIYVYFRQHESQTVMVIMNQNASEKPVAPARFAEILDGFSSGRDIFSEKIYSLDKEIRIKGTGILVLELLP